jgi:tripartite motif-containing protein 71
MIIFWVGYELKLNFQYNNIFIKAFLCYLLFFLGLVSAPVTHAEYALVDKLGVPGHDDIKFIHPYGIAIDSSGGYVYVADTGNNRIQKFSKSNGHLHFVSYIGDQNSAKACSQGSGKGQFNAPKGIAVDIKGNVYVADSGNRRFQVFDRNGEYINDWKRDDFLDDGWVGVEWIAVDSSDNVYVASRDNPFIEKYYHNFFGWHLVQK